MEQLDEKIENKNKVCFNCLSKNVEIEYEKTDLDGQADWLPVVYFHPYIVCKEKKCGEILSAPESVIICHDAACVAQGILRPKEIKEIRKTIQKSHPFWGKNDQQFSTAFKVGISQMSRWERGEYFINKKSNHDLQQLLVNEEYRKSFEEELSKDEIKKEVDSTIFRLLEKKGKWNKLKEIKAKDIFA